MVFVVIAYGVVMEFVQRDFVANRSFNIMDIIADSAGAILGFAWLAAKAKNTTS